MIYLRSFYTIFILNIFCRDVGVLHTKGTNATYILTNFQIKMGLLINLRGQKSTLSGPHIPVSTFPLSRPIPPPLSTLTEQNPGQNQLAGHRYELVCFSNSNMRPFSHQLQEAGRPGGYLIFFFGEYVPRGFPKVGSRERVFLEK